MRNARYGLRGVRVGEASNPGPPQTRSRSRAIEEAEDMLARLEHDLTIIDSDDEPLVRGGSDRNVIPRLEASVTGVCWESCRFWALSQGATSAMAEPASVRCRPSGAVRSPS